MPRILSGSLIREGRLGALPAAFNPPTVAHLALADAAAEQHGLDQVAFVLPREFPHKPYSGASFDDRVEMLRAALGDDPARAIVSTEGGLFLEIARELREACGERIEIALLCGRDAAERIVGWDYGNGPTFAEQLEEFDLLVGTREGAYQPPPALSGRIRTVELSGAFDEVSSSAVREAIRSGGERRTKLPPGVAAVIEARGLYAP